MAELSPTAQAILDAAMKARYNGSNLRVALADALRVLAGCCPSPGARLMCCDIADELAPPMTGHAAVRMVAHAQATARDLADELGTLQESTLPALEARLEELRTSLEVMARDLSTGSAP